MRKICLVLAVMVAVGCTSGSSNAKTSAESDLLRKQEELLHELRNLAQDLRRLRTSSEAKTEKKDDDTGLPFRVLPSEESQGPSSGEMLKEMYGDDGSSPPLWCEILGSK